MNSHNSPLLFLKNVCKRPLLCLTSLTLLSSGLVKAQESVKLDKIEVKSEAFQKENPLKQAADISILVGRDKEKKESTNLGQSLENESGVDVISTGNQAGKPVIRGLSGNRIRILSNGVASDHQQFGVRHSPNIEPYLTDSLEVIRGASSLLYGSDALGGAINIAPLSLNFSKTSQIHGDTLFGVSSNNTQWDTGTKVYWNNSKWSTYFGIIGHLADNINTPNESTNIASRDDEPKFSGDLNHTNFNQINTSMGLGYKSNLGPINLRYTHWDNEQNFLHPSGQAIGQMLTNNDLQINAKLVTSDLWTLKPTLKYQNNKRLSNKPGQGFEDGFDGNLDLNFNQYIGKLEAHHGSLLGFDRGTLGLTYLYKDQNSDGKVQLSPGGNVSNLGAFVFEEKSFGKFTLQTGFRQDLRNIRAQESKTQSSDILFSGTESRSYNATTGSVGGVYEISKAIILASNIGKGFRAPSLFELFANGQHGGVAAIQQGNSNLKAENSLNTDLSLRWRSSHYQFKFTGYHNRIFDYIYLEDTGTTQAGSPVFQYNQADAALTGAELETQVQVLTQVLLSFTGQIVYGENLNNEEELPLMPANKLRLGMTYFLGPLGPLQSIYMGFDLHHSFSKDTAPREPFSQFDSMPFGSASTDAYTLLGLNAGFEYANSIFGTEKPVRVDIQVKNLFNTTYRDFLDTYKGYALSPGRNINLNLRIPFGV